MSKHDGEELFQQARTVFPRKVETVQVHENGDDFRVIEINSEWMFRFARGAVAQEVLENEKRFLPTFEPDSPLPIPHIEYFGSNYIGYRKIQGAPITQQLFSSFSVKARAKVAGQIGEFLSTLHAFPLDRAYAIGLTEGWHGWRRDAARRFGSQVVPLLSDSAKDRSLAFLDDFFRLSWDNAVIHGDFIPKDHVFFDADRQSVCGVIDFGDLTIEDAATDFKSLVKDCGETFTREVMSHYSRRIDSNFYSRTLARIRADPIFESAYALEYGFDDRFRDRLSRIEAAFGTAAPNNGMESSRAAK